MARQTRSSGHRVAAFIISTLLFVISIGILVLNVRAMSFLERYKLVTQVVEITSTKNQIVLGVLPLRLVRTATKAMIAVGSAGIIFGLLSILLSSRPYVLAHVWTGIFAAIFGIAGLLSEYVSYYKSSALVIESFGTNTNVGQAKGWYSTGSWFCQTQGIFQNPVGSVFAQACREDVATRVMIINYFMISIGLIIVASTMRREVVKLEPLKIETKRYNGGEMHNVPL